VPSHSTHAAEAADPSKEQLNMSTIRPLLIAALVMTEVGLWQWRMVIATRGNRMSAMLLGAIGAVLQITAISQVVTNLGDPLSVAAYAGGVGFGVLLGLIAGERFTPGPIGVKIITDEPGVAAGLWARGWPATVQTGHGEDGPISIVSVAIERQQELHLQRDAIQLAPEASWSTEELRSAVLVRRGRGPANPRRRPMSRPRTRTRGKTPPG
jgi:uncharacterized protein YebE (UPF0316 family)